MSSRWATMLGYLGRTPVESSAPIPALRSEIRVGQGFDVHRFSDDPDRVLVLGGVLFDGERGLVGHSDADVISHACADALLGAAGLGDIGMHFPDTDPQWRGADSLTLLRHVVSLLDADGWAVNNIDTAVICEAPKLAPRRDEIQRILTNVIGAPVTVKGNRAERLGAIGRTEGIVCFATALIQRESATRRSGKTLESGAGELGAP